MSHPQPREDGDNREHLAGWRAGRLMLQRCTACGHAIFYPRPMCPSCWSDALAWQAADGRGTIVSFSLVWRPNHPAFNDAVPIVLAEVRLAEGASLLARVLCADHGTVASGQAVVLAADAAARLPLPAFRQVSA